MKINVTGGTLPQQEIDYYTEAALKKYPNRNITAIDFDIDGEYVNATYHFNDQPFERIRRITGYLVGTLDRFNNAKRAEERDRHVDLGGPFKFVLTHDAARRADEPQVGGEHGVAAQLHLVVAREREREKRQRRE